MIGRVLAEVYGVAEDRMLSTYKASRSAGVAPVLFSHGGAFHLMDEGPFEHLAIERRVFSGKRVLFLTRDVRDTLVSYYFQQAKRERVFEGGMPEFLRDERFGARKLVRFLTLWFQNQDASSAFKMIRYEDMQLDARATLAGVLDFLRWEGIEPAAVASAVEYGSFDNMKAMEAAGQFNRKMMRPGDPKDADSFKVRKGKIGGFSAYLDEADLAYIEKVIQDEGDPACDWYLWHGM